jgi:hypothetical protein
MLNLAALAEQLQLGWVVTNEGVADFERGFVAAGELIVRYRLADGRTLEAFILLRDLEQLVDEARDGTLGAPESAMIAWLQVIIEEQLNNAPVGVRKRIDIL